MSGAAEHGDPRRGPARRPRGSAAADEPVRLVETHGRDVMISFNTKDGARAAELYAALRQAGLTVYCSKFDIQAGDQWRGWVSKAAHNAKLLIALSSKGSYNSQHVAEELVLFKERMDELTPRDFHTEYGNARAAFPPQVRLEILNVVLDAATPWVWTDEQKSKYEAQGVRESDPRFATKIVLAGKQNVIAHDDAAWNRELPKICRIALLICNRFDENTRPPGRPPTTLWRYRRGTVRWLRGRAFAVFSSTYKTALTVLLAAAAAVGAVFAVLYLMGFFNRPAGGSTADTDPPVIEQVEPQTIPFSQGDYVVRFAVRDNRTPPEHLRLEAASDNEALLPPGKMRFLPYQPGTDRTLVIGAQHQRLGGTATVTLRVTDENDNVARKEFRVTLQKDPNPGNRTHGVVEVGRTAVRALSFRAEPPDPPGRPAWRVAGRPGGGAMSDVNAKPVPVRIEYRPGPAGLVEFEQASINAVTDTAGALKKWLVEQEGVLANAVFVVLTSDATENVARPSVTRFRQQLADRLGRDVDVLRADKEGQFLFAGVMQKLNVDRRDWGEALVLDVGLARIRGAYRNTAKNQDQTIFDEIPGPATLVRAGDRDGFKRFNPAAADGRAGWLAQADRLVETRVEPPLANLLLRNVAWDDAKFIPTVYLSGDAVRSMVLAARPEAVGADPVVPIQFEGGGRVSDVELFRRQVVADGDAVPDVLTLDDRLAAGAILKHLAARLKLRDPGRKVFFFNDVDSVWQSKYLEGRLNAP